MARWIVFEEIEIETGYKRKTKIFEVATKEDRLGLGVIKWYGAWRKYCFFPAEQTIFEWDCLRDIAEFCQSETKKYKEERWLNKSKVQK